MFFADLHFWSLDPMLIRHGFSFLEEQEQSKVSIPTLPACGKCGLWKSCLSPKMDVSGRGEKKILLIGEAPGADEDSQGKPFVGVTGRFLQSTLAKLGIDMRRDCWLLNALSCRPRNNAKPTEAQISYCRPKVINHIRNLNPENIILLGGVATNSLLGYLWKDKIGKVSRWVGWNIPSQQLNAWISPVFHPSYIWRSRNKRTEKLDPVLEGLFERYLSRALSKEGRPWSFGSDSMGKEVPSYKKMVKIELIPRQIAQILGGMIQMKLPIAFDFETEGLKPDGDGAPEIVSCSVSNGVITYAFPWYGQDMMKRFKELLLSDVPKIGANIKYEERFCQRYLGIGVNNWKFDTVVAAHVLDNRSGICSLKFQSFVLLGQPIYNTAVSKYLRPPEKGGYCKNNIREGMRRKREQILLYNGLDSLLTVKVAEIQAKQLGISLQDLEEDFDGKVNRRTEIV